jgi:hypothetical protein
MRIELRTLLIPVAVSLATAMATPAKAQDEAAGRVLFDDAMTLLNRGQISDACPKFEESLRQSYNINAQYFLADCLEKMGKTASAWTTFLTVTSRSREAGDDKRERAARKRADGLERRLVRFKIIVNSEVDGLEVRRNGVLVGRPMWATAVPIDPGSYEFSASAPGYLPYETTVNATSPGRVFEVNIPELSRKSIPVASAPAVRSSPSEPVMNRHAARDSELLEKRQSETLVKRPSEATGKSDEMGSWHTASWIAGGVGVATMVTGGILAILAKRSYDDAKSAYEICADGECDSRELDREKSAISRANLGGGLLIGGAVLTAAAGAFLIWTSSSSSSESSSQSSVSLRVSPMGLSLEGKL